MTGVDPQIPTITFYAIYLVACCALGIEIGTRYPVGAIVIATLIGLVLIGIGCLIGTLSFKAGIILFIAESFVLQAGYFVGAFYRYNR